MATAIYDIAGMRRIASDIREKMQKFEAQQKKMEQVVEDTNSFWEDNRQKKYVEEFDKGKKSMENVKKNMIAYAKFLEEAAKKFDNDQNV